MCLPAGSLNVQGCQSVGKPVGRRVQFKLPLQNLSVKQIIFSNVFLKNCIKYLIFN